MTREEADKRRFVIKMQIAKIKKKTFATKGAENKYMQKHLLPLQKELIDISKY